mmetsp:Transcript_45479/g.92991  ORF Transcript_45479/g.92991 Transcript_45479/m.92991 type:complete len:220 (+) Transcript_45479:1057-1716(+)
MGVSGTSVPLASTGGDTQEADSDASNGAVAHFLVDAAEQSTAAAGSFARVVAHSCCRRLPRLHYPPDGRVGLHRAVGLHPFRRCGANRPGTLRLHRLRGRVHWQCLESGAHRRLLQSHHWRATPLPRPRAPRRRVGIQHRVHLPCCVAAAAGAAVGAGGVAHRQRDGGSGRSADAAVSDVWEGRRDRGQARSCCCSGLGPALRVHSRSASRRVAAYGGD